MTTQGNAKFNKNNHPFEGAVAGQSFALAHNGVLYNDLTLRSKHQLPKTDIETDSYVAVQLIEQKKALSPNSLRFMAEEVSGSFSFTVLDDDGIWFIKGDSPLCLRFFSELGIYLYASTSAILDNALSHIGFSVSAPADIDISMGDIVHISTDNTIRRDTFTNDGLLYHKPFSLYGYYGWDGCEYDSEYETAYLDDLRYMASYFGYSPKIVDRLLAHGLSTTEIEDFLYGFELGEEVDVGQSKIEECVSDG